MPHELFGSSLVRPASARSRRSSTVLFSAIVHTAVLVALVVVPLVVGDDVLPIPQRVIAFFSPSEVMPTIPAPPPPPRPHEAGPVATDAAAAPTQAPDRITPETGIEHLGAGVASVGPPGVGTIDGIGDTGQFGRVEPPPPPPPVKPIRVSSIHEPQRIVNVLPVYPAMARAAHVEGTVIIEATIDVRGNVESARVLKSAPLLDQAALDAVRQWKYTPTLLGGVPVPVIMTVTVVFRLQ